VSAAHSPAEGSPAEIGSEGEEPESTSSTGTATLITSAHTASSSFFFALAFEIDAKVRHSPGPEAPALEKPSLEVEKASSLEEEEFVKSEKTAGLDTLARRP